jgi:hypothetical protein
MAHFPQITFKFPGDGPYRRDVPPAFEYAKSKKPNPQFALNIIYDDAWFDTQTIVVELHNIGLQLHDFLTYMKVFLNSEALHMVPYEIVFDDNVIATG